MGGKPFIKLFQSTNACYLFDVNRNGIISILFPVLFFFIIAVSGCTTGDEARPSEIRSGFPAQYAAELFPLLPEDSSIHNIASKDGILYLSIVEINAGPRSTKIIWADMREDGPIAVTVPYEISDDEQIDKVYPNDDGTLSLFVMKFDSPDRQGTIIDLLITVISLDGELASQFSAWQDLGHEEHKVAFDFMTDAAGRTYLATFDCLYVWENNGRLVNKAQAPGQMPKLSRSPGGEPYLFWPGPAGYRFAPLDPETGGIGTARNLTAETGIVQVMTGINSDFLFLTDKNIYEYDLESGNETEIITLAAAGLADKVLGRMAPVISGKIVYVADVFAASRLYVIKEWAEREMAEETEDKTEDKAKPVLSFGMAYSLRLEDYTLDARNFNGISDDVRIEVKYYGRNEEDNGIRELALDLVSGRAPDIILIPRGTPMDIYIKKGVFADLYPLLDAEPSISRDELMTDILSIFEMEGKLYSFPLNFNIRTMGIPASIAPEGGKWTLDEMMAIAELYLPDSYFFLHEDKEHVLSICLQANIDYLLNTALEGQSINRELFAKVLAFANRFAPEERPVDWDHLISRREAGQLQCYCCETVRGANKHLDHLFGEPFTYVGYPSETSNGHLLYSDYNLAISSSCKDKEAAFRFVASMLTNEKQYNFRVRSFNLNGFANFPLLKSALEEKMEYEMHEDRGVHWPIYGRTMSHGPYTEADVQAVWDIIGNTDAVWSFDTQVFDIISEEAGKYFDGDKSVMETIDIIENRLRLYLLERAE